ncbi:MAG: hypothetical protein ABFS18_05325 [Thermodesulfobacteriota bacterium]
MSKQQITVLIAEDEDIQVQSWERDIHDFNSDNPNNIEFITVTADTVQKALKIINSQHIDCGIIDLRLPEDDDEGTSPEGGNKILQTIINEIPIPAVVLSGYPQEAEDFVKDSMINVLEKDVGNQAKALDWLAGFAPLIETLQHTQRKIRMETGRLFHKSLWPRWQTRDFDAFNPEAHKNAVTRQVVSHLTEYLTLSETESPLFLPDEFYLKPPLRTERIHTGDLLEIDGTMQVVLTPQCNMAHTYPENILMAKCVEEKVKWADLIEKLTQTDSKKKKEKAEKELRDFATQAHATNSHFIPPCDDRGPWLVDFKQISTQSSSEIEVLKKNRFASLAPQFIPNLVQRFASYMGRVGQPDIDVKELASHLAGIHTVGEGESCQAE